MIINLTRNSVIASRVEIARTPFARMKGLLGRDSLPAGAALVITQCGSLHMLFMKFVLDVIFVGKDQRVVGLCRGLPPFAFSPIFFKSSCALELPAGTIDATKTQIGDQLDINVQSGN